MRARRNRGGGAVRVRVGREVRGDLPLTGGARMSATRSGLAGGAHVAVTRALGELAQLLLGCCTAGPRPKGARARGLEEQPGRGWATSTSRPKTRREK